VPRVPITRNENLKRKILEAMQQRRLIIIAQRETTRIVRPERPDAVVFVAREEL